MAVCELTLFSHALGMQTSVVVLLPQAAPVPGGWQPAAAAAPWRCLYLLHGHSDNESCWLRYTTLEKQIAAYPDLCVVMPRGDRSYYTDMQSGWAYYTYVAQELPAFIGRTFPVSSRREDTGVAGLSMGGYGAFKIALRECGRFGAGAGLSPVADIRARAPRSPGTFCPIFGPDLAIPPQDDLLFLADEKRQDSLRPRLYMGVGTEDGLYGNAQTLRRSLERGGYDFTYRESPGAHNWDFWNEYIGYVLQWMWGGDPA